MLLTVLGEYVLPASGSAWQETLIRALETLGHKTPAARRALARSVAAGWLTTERHGRRSRVHLTPGTADMLRSGTERIYSFGDPWEWDERWLLVVLRVPEERREIRHQVRTRLAWAGFGSLGGGLWLSPHAERERELHAVAGDGSVAEVVSFFAQIGAVGDPAKLVAEAWDLDGVAEAYRSFIARFGRARASTPEAMFRAQTQMVHEWRKFPFLDPDLPADVLPSRWPRERAHDLFRERHDAWHSAAQDYFRALEGQWSEAGRAIAGATSVAMRSS
jgi:phenylacetic acid degradation operon negative regulatory protein